MSGQRVLKRLVVLVDGSEKRENKIDTNQSSIQRLKQLVREGACHSSGRVLTQIPRCYVSAASAPKLSDKFRSKSTSDDTADLIKTIVKDVSSTLESPEDELWLYGSGHGAFVARAVAGIVHRMGLLKTQFVEQFDDLFDDFFESTLALIKAELEDDFRHGPQLMEKIKAHANGRPRIPFVGLFDTVMLTLPKTSYDISLVSSIEILRHALAMNENRSSRTPQILKIPDDAETSRQSLIQAWFLGRNDDLCGGTANDGLSLYPLQWIVLESIYAGLSLLSRENSTTGDSPLSLVFPQYAGNLPNLDVSEDIEWRLWYTNGIKVSMFDLQSTHAARLAGGDIHSLKLDPERYSRRATRKVFELDRLKGWCGNGPYGTIIHPSLFCILDRYPRHLELPSFKLLKANISNFQDMCLVENNNKIAPWLLDLQLQASGVKAFRILVCGKSGVGKSTLINKVFGVKMTEESLSYEQGVHDINVAFESPWHPGLLIHDSRGWQAGSDAELDLIAKFLRHRAFQEDPAKALHVIWFCVDADVSRIEEADKRTFATIAQFSHQVPVFVVGTKKDKLTGYCKMKFLEELMEKTNDYSEAKKLAEEKANAMAEAQFAELRTQLSQIEQYKADGYCCLSKDDDAGVKDLLSQTLGLIVDERVRLFCVAAQVVDVEQKINSAIIECMRLGTHAIRTAAVPLPFSGMIGTPTVSRLICEHVLQCFGFPKAAPTEVEQIMKDIVLGNLRSFMAESLAQFATVSAVAVGVAIPTAGVGVILGAAGCLWGLPPAARMLLKCSCDMILILERSFRYNGKYVSVKQIEDAAKYYMRTTIKTFNEKEKLLRTQVHDEINQLIPLKRLSVSFNFNKLRNGIEEIIYRNRFSNPPDYTSLMSSSSIALGSHSNEPAELFSGPVVSALPGDTLNPPPSPAEPASGIRQRYLLRPAVELDSTEVPKDGVPMKTTMIGTTATSDRSQGTTGKQLQVQPSELEGDTLIGGPGEELEALLPTRSKTESRWGKLTSWKIGTKKSKTK
ncbi:Hypothetical protein NCS54_01474000 [Fusarium falciforme]|uniref:Hypothetical protein n=1 Tax=Fusarium falciforme TaxID=195108 RepID=UPI0023007276|nr:Hypothetical protein NCS54_01474000 [Fusarium falciforme]WAO97035.1 Hypothetical protein NCS54_01474000 [Fusarium falciforme]